MVDTACRWVSKYGRHGPTVVYTRRFRDLFAKRWWVYCWGCDDQWGPFPDRGLAHMMSLVVDDLTPVEAP